MSLAYWYEVQNIDVDVNYKSIRGVLSVEGEQLLFEYKLYNKSRTAISALNKYAIEVDILKSLRFKKTLFNAYLIIETVQTVFLEPLPGSSKGMINLHIDRSDRRAAEDFCTKINIALDQRKKQSTI